MSCWIIDHSTPSDLTYTWPYVHLQRGDFGRLNRDDRMLHSDTTARWIHDGACDVFLGCTTRRSTVEILTVAIRRRFRDFFEMH